LGGWLIGQGRHGRLHRLNRLKGVEKVREATLRQENARHTLGAYGFDFGYLILNLVWGPG